MAEVRRGNLFAGAEPPETGEKFESLLELGNLLIERIVSSDGPKSEVYVQAQDEWVVLVRGTAVLTIEAIRTELVAGDYVFIPAGVSHKVETTSEAAMWLAVHLPPPARDEQASR
jgi:cupin 2 domain-containing protein